MICKKCIYPKWIGVDGYGDYCSHPKQKGVIYCGEVKVCKLRKENISS